MTKNKSKIPNQGHYPEYFEEDTISLIDILFVLARQLKIIIILPTLACTITIIYAIYFTSPVYECTAKILSSSGAGGTSQVTGLAAQFGIALPSSQSEIQWVYPEIVKSRTLARAMLKRKFDTKKYGSQKPLLQILTYGDEEPTIGLDTLIRSGVNTVIGMIKIQKNSFFYDLTISTSESLFSRDFTVALIEELDAHQREYNKTKTAETKQFILERIFDTRKELETAEETLKDFTDRNRRIENSPGLQLERQRIWMDGSAVELDWLGVWKRHSTTRRSASSTTVEEKDKLDLMVWGFSAEAG